MMPTPNYVLTEEHAVSSGPYDTKTLPAGSFVRPIDPVYLPRHITESDEYKYFSPERQIYCYTRIGIVAIPKYKVRRT
jgi:hypothetical protein